MPIRQPDENTFQVLFEKSLVFNPDTLMTLVQKQLAGTNRKEDYVVSVKDCAQNQTIFAYEVNRSRGDLKPCRGRRQQKDCYFIEISFLAKKSFNYGWLLIGLIPIVLGVIYVAGRSRPQGPLVEDVARSISVEAEPADHVRFGNTVLFESKGMLSVHGEIAELSANETKALSILAANLNDVVERDHLMKKIWEDEGVVVIPRNVDVLISKLRKRLSEDVAVKILTVHGKGYKMVV